MIHVLNMPIRKYFRHFCYAFFLCLIYKAYSKRNNKCQNELHIVGVLHNSDGKCYFCVSLTCTYTSKDLQFQHFPH